MYKQENERGAEMAASSKRPHQMLLTLMAGLNAGRVSDWKERRRVKKSALGASCGPGRVAASTIGMDLTTKRIANDSRLLLEPGAACILRK